MRFFFSVSERVNLYLSSVYSKVGWSHGYFFRHIQFVCFPFIITVPLLRLRNDPSLRNHILLFSILWVIVDDHMLHHRFNVITLCMMMMMVVCNFSFNFFLCASLVAILYISLNALHTLNRSHFTVCNISVYRFNEQWIKQTKIKWNSLNAVIPLGFLLSHSFSISSNSLYIIFETFLRLSFTSVFCYFFLFTKIPDEHNNNVKNHLRWRQYIHDHHNGYSIEYDTKCSCFFRKCSIVWARCGY